MPRVTSRASCATRLFAASTSCALGGSAAAVDARLAVATSAKVTATKRNDVGKRFCRFVIRSLMPTGRRGRVTTGGSVSVTGGRAACNHLLGGTPLRREQLRATSSGSITMPERRVGAPGSSEAPPALALRDVLAPDGVDAEDPRREPDVRRVGRSSPSRVCALDRDRGERVLARGVDRARARATGPSATEQRRVAAGSSSARRDAGSSSRPPAAPRSPRSDLDLDQLRAVQVTSVAFLQLAAERERLAQLAPRPPRDDPPGDGSPPRSPIVLASSHRAPSSRYVADRASACSSASSSRSMCRSESATFSSAVAVVNSWPDARPSVERLLGERERVGLVADLRGHRREAHQRPHLGPPIRPLGSSAPPRAPPRNIAPGAVEVVLRTAPSRPSAACARAPMGRRAGGRPRAPGRTGRGRSASSPERERESARNRDACAQTMSL